MKKSLINYPKTLIYFFIFAFTLFIFLSFINKTSAQVCLPLTGYLVWSGTWEPGRMPVASTSEYVLTASPIFVSSGNVGIGYTSPVYKLQVNGDISGTRLCIGSDCRSIWPGGGVAGSGSVGQVAFWTASDTISGDNNLFWDNTNKRLGIGTTTPQTSLYVVGNVTANTFLGTINAANVSSGEFGANTGGGNYYFMGNVGIGTTAPGARLYVKTTDLNTIPFQVEALVNPMLGWSYRRPITISNTGSALTDYQVYVTLDTASLISAGKMRADCGDIRFTDSDGLIPLFYWIESGCNSASTKIWVKVPSIPSGTKIIYVYYGNPSASSASNGDNTFLFFDDFPGTTLNSTKWTVIGYGAYSGVFYSVSDGILTIWSDNTMRIIRANINFAPADTIVWESKWLKTADSSWHAHFLVQSDNVDRNRLGLGDYYYAGANMGALQIMSGVGSYPKDFGPFSSNVWYIARIFKKSSANLYIDALTADRTFINSYETIQSGWGAVTWIPVAWQYENIQVKYDWVFARKYASPEPTISVGAEEGAQSQQQTVFYIQNQTGNVGIWTTNPAYKLDVAGDVHGTSFYTSSDIRFKTNIQKVENVLNKLENIQAISFDWNELYQKLGRSDGRRQIGLIAQEVEKYFPELVSEWEQDGVKYKAVDYSRFTAILLEAIKEQQKEINELKAQLNSR